MTSVRSADLGVSEPQEPGGRTVRTAEWHGLMSTGFRTKCFLVSLGEAGEALRRFLKGQGCVSADKQEKEICGRRSSMGRARSWEELDGEVAGGCRVSKGRMTLFMEHPAP